jgi:DNA-binding transcriptional ArsR family regulator
MDRVFHALGDPTRRAIVDMLAERLHSVSTLAAPLNITLTAVAQHLQILEEAGLVHTQKIGRVRSCCIVPAGFAAARKLDWRPKVDVGTEARPTGGAAG